MSNDEYEKLYGPEPNPKDIMVGNGLNEPPEKWTVIDIFDSLPEQVQRNDKLLRAFCRWYLDNWQPKEKDRMDVKTIAKRLNRKYPQLKSRELAEQPAIATIQREGNYSIKTIQNWIRQAVKIPPGRPKKK